MADEGEVVVEEQSMDDFMGDQFDALESEDSESESAPAAEEAAPATEEISASDEAPEDDVAKAAESDTESEGSEPVSQTITAPQSMSAKDRESFYALPPESQQWISDRVKAQEADYTRKTMEVAEQRKVYDKLEEAIAPRRQQFAMNGMDEGTAIGQLLALSDYADNDPVGFSRYLLNQRGIPISALTTEPGVENYVDPQMLEMRERMQGFENHFAQQQDQQLEYEGQIVSGVIEDFASSNPFYGELEGEMVPIVSALRESRPGLTSDQYLQTAYKMAVAANDEVSAKIEVDRKAKSEAERIAKAKKSSAAAKRANGTSIRTTGTLPSGAAKAKSVDDFIGALVDDRMTA
jgi:hypothetical protein|tara:strand:- start:1339 stop:2388 length:1050 start_codon:yes stop_codon:yes gene_type:complete